MDAVELIKLYETLFVASAVIAVLGFGFAIFFFFFFRIRDVRALMTGKARAETIRRIEEQNAKTGSLRAPSIGLSSEFGKTGNTGKTGRTSANVIIQPVMNETGEMRHNQSGAELMETSVLTEYVSETTVLNQTDAGIRFDLTESTLVIHTNEII